MSDSTLPSEQDQFEARRWGTRSIDVFAAMDTMPQITERVLAIVGEGRVMNRIATYVHDDGLRDLGHLDHSTGLRKGGHAGYPAGHQVWQKEDQAGFAVYLTHGRDALADGFSVSVMKHEAETEKAVRDRYRKSQTEDRDFFDRCRNITQVKIEGWPGEPNRNDRIEILDWNDHGVLRHTVISFVEPDWCDSGRIIETNYAIVGHRTNDDGSPHQFTPGAIPEVFATYGPATDEASQAAARESAKKELTVVEAREGIDIAWVVEEKVTRERRSIY